MKNVRIIYAAIVMLLLLSCSKEKIKGSGPTITETRDLVNFTVVSASGSSNVFITKGAAFKVEIKGFSNLLPHYETKLLNNTLLLGFKQGINIKNDNTAVYITMPELVGVNTAGSGNIEVVGNFSGNTKFEAGISGSGNIDIQEGFADKFISSINGSGHLKALDFEAKQVETTTSGSGNTEITATEQLKVKISGSGNVYYRGSPVITVNISGSGAVIPR
jgi:hypothetical protein